MKNIQVQDTYALDPLALEAPVGAAQPLYGTTGTATDGPMTQQATTQALLDTLGQALAAASYATLPLAEAQLLGRGAAGPLHPGACYRIQGRPDTGLGHLGDVLVQALDEHSFNPTAVLLGHRPDYDRVSVWSPDYPGPVSPPVVHQGTGATYTSTTQPYEALAPDDSGVLDTLTGDDVGHLLTLPFAFTFGGVEYTQVTVDTNGRLSFGNTGSDLGNVLSDNDYVRPQAVLCGGDLYVTDGVGLVRTFCVGTAPNRQLVVDYSQVSSYRQRSDTANYFNGQLVLEETTNNVRLGQASALPDYTFAQGLQYPGQVYETHPYGSAPLLGTTTIYAPAPAGSPPAPPAPPVFSPADYACLWNGQTWWLTGLYAAYEPGTTADWSVATGPGADQYGNTVPLANGVTYDVATNTLSKRWDAAGNEVDERQGQALDAFPWDRPGFALNRLRGTRFEPYTLHNARGSSLYNNELVNCQFTTCVLQNATLSTNTITNAQVFNWAPQVFAQNTIFGNFNAYNYNLQNAFLVNGYAVQDPSYQLNQQLANVQANLQASLLDNMFRTYYQGQVSYQNLDLLQPYTSDYTPHDLIVVRGVTTAPLCLRNQDYHVRGESAVFGSGFFGAGTNARRLTVDGVTFTNVLHVHESYSGDGSGRGHDIHVLNSTIYSIGMFQGGSSGYLDRHTFTNCHIGLVHREAAYNGSFGHKVCLDRCTVGRGVLPGAIQGAYFHNPLSALFDTYDGSTCSLLVSNSVLYLADGMSLEPAGRHSVAPYLVFENCSVIYSDGATKNLSTSAPTYLLDTTRHAADVAALLDDSHWNTAGYGEYTGPAFAWLFPAYYEAPASASGRGYRYVLDGQGRASRYASS